MDIEKIQKLKGREPRLILDSTCRRSAVCIPLIKGEGGTDVLFEIRSSHIEDQPGDICFPGGMLEEGETASQAAIRECCEELLVSPADIEIIGPSDVFHSFSVAVFPYAVYLKGVPLDYSRDEVDSLFTVPLQFFMDTEPEIHTIEWKVKTDADFPYRLIQGGENYKWRRQLQEEPFYIYENHVIWGITAKIISAFAGIIRE